MSDLVVGRHLVIPPTYRAFRIGQSGGYVGSQVLDAATDAAAAASARTLATLHSIELWERARFLGRFDPDPQVTYG